MALLRSHRLWRSLLCLSVSLLLARCQSFPSHRFDAKRIVLFGDSLTEKSFEEGGWGAMIANAFVRRADVLNRGISAYTSTMALRVFDGFAAPYLDEKTVMVTVLLGTNDAGYSSLDQSGEDTLNRVPLAEFRENMRQIIEKIKALTAAPIFLMTPPPVYIPEAYKAQYELRTSSGRIISHDDVTKKYGDAVKEVAAQTGAIVVDLFQAIQGGREDWGAYYVDGVHFGAEGQRRVGEVLLGAIRERMDLRGVSRDVPPFHEVSGEA